MPDRLEDILRACTVRVTGGPRSGAGFFVAPGMVLTCVHVIGEGRDLEVLWERDGQPVIRVPVSRRVAVLEGGGCVLPDLDRDYPDIAVLGLDGLSAHPCVDIDYEWPSQKDRFQVFGYPQEGGEVQLTPAQLTYRGMHGILPRAYLDLASDTIKPGMSGAAVMNLRTKAVCGIVVASKHAAHPAGALAIPWQAVQADLSEVLVANRAFHERDQMWGTTVSRPKRLEFQLPRVVAHFTGRDDLLAEVEAALSVGRAGVITQTITGLGGVGKTQLAAAYVKAHRDEFDIVAWVRGDDGGIADLADLAAALRRPVKRRTPLERARDVLVFLSNTERRWLLVFDNAAGPQSLAQLPSSGRGQVLVTSRHRGGYDDFGAELAVDVFDADTACQYLLARSGRADEEAEDAMAIAIALGYLPLALAHAGAYCASRTGVTFGDYRDQLGELPSQDLFDSNREVFYQDTVAATWNTSITAAAQQVPLARQALEMAAYLAPEAIPSSFFSVLVDETPAGSKLVHDALDALHTYSLATLADNHVSVHRLLQKVIRDQLAGSEESKAVSRALSAVQASMPDDPQLPRTWPQWQELAPHATVLASIDAVANLDAARLVRVLNPVCRFLLSAGFPRSDLDLATRVVEVSASHLGPERPDTLTARANLARWTGEAGNAAEARDQFEALLATEERVLEASHPSTLADRDSLARWTGEAGDPAAARDQFAALLPVRRRVHGPVDPRTLITRGNLAYWTGEAGNPADARDQFAKLLRTRRRVLGANHPSTLADRDGLARWTGEAGNAAAARNRFARLLPVRQRVLGAEHPDALTTRGGLAHWTGEAGDPAAARDQFAELLRVRQRVLGAEHPDTLTARDSLAHWSGEAGDAAAAHRQFAELLGIRKRVFGREHPSTLGARGGLARWTGGAGKALEARDQFKKLLDVYVRLVGDEHPSTLAARDGLARWTGEAGDAVAAREQFKELLDDYVRVLGDEHPSTLAARGSLAHWSGEAGDAASARDHFADLLRVRRRVLGSEHPGTLADCDSLARWTGDAGDAMAARDLFADLLDVKERVFGAEHPNSLSIRGGLAYWTGKAGDAAAARNQFADLLDMEMRVLGPKNPRIQTTRGNLDYWADQAGG